MKISLLSGVLGLFLLVSCGEHVILEVDSQLMEAIHQASPTGDADFFILADGQDLSAIPNQDPANPITQAKVDLGRMLFFETALAQDPIKENCYETYSCSSCHIPSRGWLPGRIQGIADGAEGFGVHGSTRLKLDNYEETELDAQGNRPMTIMNVAYMTNTLWSGTFGANDQNIGTEDAWTGLAEVNFTGYAGLEAQNIEGFHLHRLDINDRVLDDYGYRAEFDKAFSDYPVEERYSPETASFAISAFLRTVLTYDAPFQEFLKGNFAALSVQQKKGAELFFGKARCIKCHSSPSFSAMNFYALGTKDMYEYDGLNTGPDDPRILGRGFFTGREEDNYKFKVPQLYNLKDYTHYFHGSSKQTLRGVLEFKNKAESENYQVANEYLAPKFQPLNLTESELIALEDFLENALYDPGVTRYMPDAVLSGHCFPNNDLASKQDMGCE